MTEGRDGWRNVLWSVLSGLIFGVLLFLVVFWTRPLPREHVETPTPTVAMRPSPVVVIVVTEMPLVTATMVATETPTPEPTMEPTETETIGPIQKG